MTVETTQGSLRLPLEAWTVIYAFPKAFTPGCTRETEDFVSLYSSFRELGVQVLGVSPDTLETLHRFADEKHVPFPLIPDPEKRLLKRLGAWGVKKLYGREVEGVIRTTWLVSPEGIIRHVWQPVRVKDHAAAVLATVTRLTRGEGEL